MKLWEKYLVVRRDGTVPDFPCFVIGARDPWAPAALRAYADAAELNGADAEYIESIREQAEAFEVYRQKHGAGDPEAAHDRIDDPSIAQVIRDSKGGKVFIAAAWDADQLERELAKEKD